MSDFSLSLVPKLAKYPNRQAKAADILSWLIAEAIVKPTASNCVLGEELGYAIDRQAQLVVNTPELLPFDTEPNGLEIITERTVFVGELEALICPNCGSDIVAEEWDLMPWFEQTSNGLICPLCSQIAEIHQYNFRPAWGFSDLGFTFWNWPAFTPAFIELFEQKLGCAVTLVYQRI